MFNSQRVTIYWDFVKSLEAPRVVHIRTNDVFFKGNTFAQVTVRFFSKQVSNFLTPIDKESDMKFIREERF